MKKALLIVFLMCMNQVAGAIIIDNDSYTTDTESNLDWLDITVSRNMSYESVTSQLVSGGLFSGWRYASVAELNQFLDHLGGSGNYSGYSIDHETVADRAVSLLGDTSIAEEASFGYSYGILGDFLNEELVFTGMIYDDDYSAGTLDYIDTTQSELNTFVHYSNIGSFLVRESSSVPEPASMALLALGLIGISLARRLTH